MHLTGSIWRSSQINFENMIARADPAVEIKNDSPRACHRAEHCLPARNIPANEESRVPRRSRLKNPEIQSTQPTLLKALRMTLIAKSHHQA